MSDHLEALRLFARVARRGSISVAARETGVPQSTASRTIAALERRIGVSLLARTTRRVAPTEAGSDFLARVETILAELDQAEQIARGTDELRGTLRIALGSSLAVREVIPRLPAFLERHPALKLDMVLEDHRQDLLKDGIDLALRFGPLRDSTATSRVIRSWPRVLAASPGYLERYGVPRRPDDLSAHSVILGPALLAPHLTFHRYGAGESVRIDGRLRIAGNEGAIAAAVAGLGIVMTSSGACRREVEGGQLVRILAEWDLGPHELHAVFVSGRAAKSSARAFATYLAKCIGMEDVTLAPSN